MTDSTGPSREFSPLRLASSIILISIVAAAAYLYGVSSVKPPSDSESLKIYGLDKPVRNRLDSQYSDSNGDLVADAPKDESQWLDPDVLTFCYLASDQDRYEKTWSGFLESMAEQTGKEVDYLAVESAEDQLRAIKDGRLHVTGINTGATPIAVNACGFVPICGFGKDGKPITYTMNMVVPKGSPISKVNNLSGHTLTLTNPTSNSGWKAPLTLLKKDFQLLPVRDFAVIYSNGHLESLKGITSGAYEIAAVADDEMKLAVEHGHVSDGDFEVIYESDPFPSNIFGHAHNLHPDLAEKILQCFLTFDWEGTELASEFQAFGAGEFLPISYKDDLQLIRQIDDAMGRSHVVGAKTAALSTEKP